MNGHKLTGLHSIATCYNKITILILNIQISDLA